MSKPLHKAPPSTLMFSRRNETRGNQMTALLEVNITRIDQ